MYKTLVDKDDFFTCTRIDNIEELLETLSRISNYRCVFRGVNEAKYKCYTSALVNVFLKKTVISQVQLDSAMERMIALVRGDKRIMNMCRWFTHDQTDMELLGLLQHYGFGTTILDFSYSFNSAVFFATSGAVYNNTNDIDDYISIYYFCINDPDHREFQAINVDSISTVQNHHQTLKATYGDLYQGVSDQTKNSYKYLPYSELKQISRGGLTIAGTDFLSQMNDTLTGVSFSYNLSSDRLLSQNGLFKLCSRSDVSWEEAAKNHYSGMPRKTYCLNIHKSLIQQLIDIYLKPFNINSSTIYPKSAKSVKMTKLLLKLPIDSLFRPRTCPQNMDRRTWKKYERLYRKRLKKKNFE